MTGLLYDCPGYAVFGPKLDKSDNVPTLVAGEELALIGSWTRHYCVGSVVSYANRYGDDPIAAIDEARLKGHELHYVYQLGTCISDCPRKDRYTGVDMDTTYRFEGRLFRFVPAPNRNLKMVEVTA